MADTGDDSSGSRWLNWAMLGVLVAVLALGWDMYADLVLSDERSEPASTVTSHEASSPTAKGGEETKRAEGSASSDVDDLAGYFKDAARHTDSWRAGQAFWQLGLWWIGAVVAFLWFVGYWYRPVFWTSAIVQGLYLYIFWPSLSGFGAGLSVGLWVLVTFVGAYEFAD